MRAGPPTGGYVFFFWFFFKVKITRACLQSFARRLREAVQGQQLAAAEAAAAADDEGDEDEDDGDEDDGDEEAAAAAAGKRASLDVSVLTPAHLRYTDTDDAEGPFAASAEPACVCFDGGEVRGRGETTLIF